MGGAIGCEANEPRGARFRVRLPVSASEVGLVVPAAYPAADPGR
jgi:hypothetical protein